MQSILDAINEWIKEILIGAINGNLSTMFGDVNEKVGTIAAEVGQTPQGWNANIFSMIQTLSENVIVPIAGLVITYVLCYELISMVTEKNNMHDVDTSMFFKWVFKAFVAVYLVTHTFDITMAVFDMAQHVVSGAAGVIGGSTEIDVAAALASMQSGLDAMEIPELLLLVMETSLVSLCMKIMSVLITVILYGRMIKTAIHEIAHAKLHDIDLNAPKDEQQPHVDRRTREVEAESVAYTVCQHYGLDTSDYSFGYVAGWSSGRELSELKSSLETIRSAAAEIINSIDENLAELQKAQDKEQTAGQEQPTREGQEAAPEKPDPEAAAPGKSGAQEKAGAAPKEAFTPETIYRVRRNPYSDSRENSYLLQAYVTQENGRAKMGDVLYTGTPEKCRELMGQLKSGELTEGDVKQLYAKAQETAQTAGQDKDTFSIYQIKGGDETRDFRFEPYDRLQAAGNVVDRANYELVYSAPLAPETSLEDIYTCFNIDHPKDFKGHSLSVSDVVVLHQDGQDAAHFVDSVGFREVPEFLQEQKQLTPDDLETGETVKTPRGTFHVTAMSREQIEAAGYGFHHQSDDGKYLIMGNGTRAFAVAAEQAQRDNPLKTAEQTTEQNGNMIDGIINNTPTVDELEAKVKAGEQISLVDLANAVKADKERGKGAKPEKKPSIRAQLRADKEKAQKKNAKQKSQDLERS